MPTANGTRLLAEYAQITDAYQALPAEEQEGKAYEEYEDALLKLVHAFAEEVRGTYSTPRVDANTAGMVLHHLRPGHPGARKPGSFTEALLTAWDKADNLNSALLTSAFPEIAACLLVSSSAGGIETLAILSQNGA
jgi:hypothetical protein